MKKLFLLLALTTLGCSHHNFQRTLEGVMGNGTPTALTSAEVASGLKEALMLGAKNSVIAASAKDGFFKNPKLFIPFPEEAQKVKNTALQLGLTTQVNAFEETLNRAAEEAVKEATPILVDAIASLSIDDAFGLLRGGDQAATDYLKEKTESALTNAFRPTVQEAVNKMEVTKYWAPLAQAYNTASTFTGGQAVNPDLTGYVTSSALDGLFLIIASEEADIRENPAARVTELLKRVFGSDHGR